MSLSDIILRSNEKEKENAKINNIESTVIKLEYGELGKRHDKPDLGMDSSIPGSLNLESLRKSSNWENIPLKVFLRKYFMITC